MKDVNLLTTGEVAAYCGVSQQTAIRWCDRGLIASHRIPGSLHRRVSKRELRAFIDRNMISIPESQK